MGRATKLHVGDLVARVEAPTMLHRVTSMTRAFVRLLPFQRSGREVALLSIKGQWMGDGSIWSVVGSTRKDDK